MPKKKAVPPAAAGGLAGTGAGASTSTLNTTADAAFPEPGGEDNFVAGVGMEEIESYDLPKAPVTKLAKLALPNGITLQKDVSVALVKGSTVFVNYLAACAHDEACDRNQKTITATHVLDAVTKLGWDETATKDLVKQLKTHLNEFRAQAQAKKAGVVPPAAGKSKPDSTSNGSSKPKSGIPSPADSPQIQTTAGFRPVSRQEVRGEEDVRMKGAEEEDDTEGYDSNYEDEAPISEVEEDDDGADEGEGEGGQSEVEEVEDVGLDEGNLQEGSDED